MTTQTHAPVAVGAGVSARRLTTALLLFFAGIALLYTAGFAQGSGDVLHNAAHDTRHAFTFPCH